MRVFFDVNVLLDYILDRYPFSEPAEALLDAVAEGRIDGMFSAITPPTAYYIVRRLTDAARAREIVELLVAALEVCPVDEAVLSAALRLPLADFEDAVHLASAVARGADLVVTRDPADFDPAPVEILSPTELLNRLADAGDA